MHSAPADGSLDQNNSHMKREKVLESLPRLEEVKGAPTYAGVDKQS